MKKITLLLLLSLILFSCKKKEGCTDLMAENYDYEAEVDDGSCVYNRGCMDIYATNYDPYAIQEDGSCQYNCSCGWITDDDNSNGYTLTVRNICSGNYRTFTVSFDTWFNNYVGDYICFNNTNPW